MVLVIIINKNLRRKTRSENPAQCYESSSDGFIVLAQSVLYHSFLYGTVLERSLSARVVDTRCRKCDVAPQCRNASHSLDT